MEYSYLIEYYILEGKIYSDQQNPLLAI